MNDSLMYKRQLDFVKPSELNFPITIIGAGGIGSWATLALAKMGCSNITVYDPDYVEEHNTPSQLYSRAAIGQLKVTALSLQIHRLTGSIVHFVGHAFEKPTPEMSGVLICAVDSLEERRRIWEEVMEAWRFGLCFDFFIDARMGGEILRVFTVDFSNSESIIRYQKMLSTSTPASEEVCTAKSIVYNTFMCGGVIASLIKRIAKKEPIKQDVIFDCSQLSTY